MTAPLRRTLAFRELLVYLFRAAGLTGVFRKVEGDNLATARTLPGVVGDFGGLPPGVVVTAKAEVKWDPSAAVDAARALAEEAGADIYFSVGHRRGRPADQAYVLTEASVLARLLAERAS